MSSSFADYLWTQLAARDGCRDRIRGRAGIHVVYRCAESDRGHLAASHRQLAPGGLFHLSGDGSRGDLVRWCGRQGDGEHERRGRIIYCTADASKGTLSVPAAFMKRLTGTPMNFDVSVGDTAWKTVGEWMMSFSASAIRNPGTVTFTD